MLDFLGKIGDFAGTVNEAAGPISQILGAIRGGGNSGKAPIVKRPPQPKSEAYAIQLLQALAQPGNPQVKALAAEELQNLMSGFQGDIRSKVMADRREQSMGRSPVFFDPERADENIAYQISRGTPMLRQQAQANAIERIMNAAGVGNYSGAEYGREQDYQRAMGASNEAAAGRTTTPQLGRLESGISGLTDVLKIFKNYQNKQPAYFPNSNSIGPFVPQNMSVYPNGNNIRWNQQRYI